MAIKILKNKKSKKKIEPYYKLKFYYMIGDADGDTTKTTTISVDNPYLERFVTLMENLPCCNGHWGRVLAIDRTKKLKKEGKLNESDFNFLMATMYADWDAIDYFYDDKGNENDLVLTGPWNKEFFTPEEIESHKLKLMDFSDKCKYIFAFSELICEEAGGRFTVFEGLKLTYVDEDGVEHKCKIV